MRNQKPNDNSVESSKKAVIYTRVSSKEQRDEGYSVEAQSRLLHSYAQKMGFQIVRAFEDVETAKQAGRTQFGKMLDFFKQEAESKPKNQRCHILLVEKTDRLYRNFEDFVALDRLDLFVHLVKDGDVISRNSDASKKLMHAIRVSMSNWTVNNLGEEASKGMLEKAKLGMYPTKAPLGYLNAEKDGKRVIRIDEKRAPLIRKMFELYATGQYSTLRLAKRMREEGLRSKKGNALTRSGIHHHLETLTYTGQFEWQGVIYDGKYEPIISRELFDKVQDMLGKKGSHRPRQKKYDWAFRGLVSCGHCGCTLTAEEKLKASGKTYIYYHCTGARGKCPEKYVEEKELARQFGFVVDAIKMDREVADWVITALRESHQDERAYQDAQIAGLQVQYRRLQDRLHQMYLDKLDGRLPDPEFYDKQSAIWRQEQAAIQEKLDALRSADQTYLDECVQLLELVQRAVSLYEKQTAKEKRELLNFVLSNSTWKDGQLTPEYRLPFNFLAVTNAETKKAQHQIGAEPSKNQKWLGN